MDRKSGVLMDIASLPSSYGIGTLGEEAYKFADFLKSVNLSYWQVRPIGENYFGGEKYQSFSAFAGNPYLIDFKLLKSDGLLEESDYSWMNIEGTREFIDYNNVFESRYKVLRKAYENSKGLLRLKVEEFSKENSYWLEDYSLYMALKYNFDFVDLKAWPNAILKKEEEVLNILRKELKDEINFWNFTQYEFFKQWNNLRGYANSIGVSIIGDISLTLKENSCELWGKDDSVKIDGIYYLINWWIRIVKESVKIYDIVKIKHFKSFLNTIEAALDNSEREIEEAVNEFLDLVNNKVEKTQIVVSSFKQCAGIFKDINDKVDLLEIKLLDNGDINKIYKNKTIIYFSDFDNSLEKEWENNSEEIIVKLERLWKGNDFLVLCNIEDLVYYSLKDKRGNRLIDEGKDIKRYSGKSLRNIEEKIKILNKLGQRDL